MAEPQPDKPPPIEFLAKFDTTVLAGLVFLAFGGGIISFYYSHIRYLPDIEWTQSIVHLATATLIGGGLAILLALSLFLPGCIWSAFLLRDERLQSAFWFQPDKDEVCLYTLLLNVGLPFGVVIFINHILLLVFDAVGKNLFLYLYGFTCAIPLILARWWIKRNLEEMLKNKDLGLEKKRRLFKYISWFLVSIIVSQLSMVLIYLFSGRPTGWAFWITTCFCTLGVFISNHFVAIHYEKSRVQAVLVALVIAALLLFIADRNSNLSVQVLAFFGLGDKSPSVDLLLEPKGADASKALGLNERCTPKSDNRLCDVKVLSRLGNEYLLKVCDPNDCKSTFKIFTLPKDAVISRISRP